MVSFSEQEMAIARIYADSILELASATGDVEVLLHELAELAGHADADPEFHAFLASPTVDTAHRCAAIEKLFRDRCTDLLVDSLQVMNRKGRLGLVPALAQAYRQAHKQLQGRIDVHVRSAVPLTDAHRDMLRGVVRDRTGKDADLIEAIQESIIGGLVIQVGDQKLDSSVARKLRTLSVRLMERAALEIHGERKYVDGLLT